MPSVITSGGIPRSVIPSPFVAPIRAPRRARWRARVEPSVLAVPYPEDQYGAERYNGPDGQVDPLSAADYDQRLPAATIPRKAASLKMFIACP